MRMPVDTRTPDDVAADLHDRLRAFVGRRVSDPHAADDVTQEVLLRLHLHFSELRTGERLDAFAYRIARNAIIDHYRSRASAKESVFPLDDLIAHIDADGAPDRLDDEGGRRELARCLEPLVRRLAQPYREALTLTDLGELSQAQAAELTGISVPGMKSRVQRARTQLHALLTSCCDVTLDHSEHIAEVHRTGPCACTSDGSNDSQRR
jgi:RNA polymerase sigma-70 factor, ECF subfamily